MKSIILGILLILLPCGLLAQENTVPEKPDIVLPEFPTDVLGDVKVKPSGEVSVEVRSSLVIGNRAFYPRLTFPSRKELDAALDLSISNLTLQDLDAAMIREYKERHVFDKSDLQTLRLEELIKKAGGSTVSGRSVLRGFYMPDPEIPMVIDLIPIELPRSHRQPLPASESGTPKGDPG